MFFPYGDNNPTSRVPVVNTLLIIINVLVYLTINFRPDAIDVLMAHAYHPNNSNFVDMLTSMFLHGGFFHILGNMLFLHIYGDNVEDRLGHAGYLVFYIAAGVVAALFHGATDTMPCIGASGAIAGVMGAYVVLFPAAKIKFLFVWLLPPLYKKFELYSWLALGMWFGGQLMSHTSGEQAGIAFAAHIGGFIAGGVISGLLVLGKVVKMETEDPRRARAKELAEQRESRYAPPEAVTVDLEQQFLEEKQRGLPCPSCVRAMSFTKFEGWQIDQCFDCGGMWLNKGSLERLLRRGQLPYSLLHPAARKPECVLLEQGERKCGHCETPLEVVNLEGVQVEGCSVCRGLWLEKGELGELQDRLG